MKPQFNQQECNDCVMKHSGEIKGVGKALESNPMPPELQQYLEAGIGQGGKGQSR